MKKILVAVLFLTMNAKAGIIAGAISKKIQKDLALYEEAMNKSEFFNQVINESSDANSIYYAKRMRLMVAPFVKFEIEHLAEFKILPIIEFRWSRKNPEGYVNYRR